MTAQPKPAEPGDPGYRHPYVRFEGTPMWDSVWKAIGDLVENKDLIEREDRHYIVGYICKVIGTGQRRARAKAQKNLNSK